MCQIGSLLPRAVQPLLNQWQPTERLVQRPRSSMLMDTIPTLTILGGIIPTAFLLFLSPLVGVVAALISFGLPGAYFKVSRAARRAEFEALLTGWKKKTEDLFALLGRMSYVQNWEITDL